MNFPKNTGLGTLSIHAGQIPDPVTGSRGAPLYQTTAFVFKNVQDAADIFALKKEGNIYTRLNNPTTEVFEKRMAAVEGGSAALTVASGAAAITYTIEALAANGGHIVASASMV